MAKHYKTTLIPQYLYLLLYHLIMQNIDNEQEQELLVNGLKHMQMDKANAKAQAHAQEKGQERDLYNEMVQWLVKGNAKFPKIVLRKYDHDYRGVHAGSPIQDEECIVSIPFKFIMTTEIAKNSDIGRKILTSGCKVRSKHSYLASFLLCERERGNNSFWHPYIQVLPQDYDNMPINFTEPEKQLLKGSMCLEKMSARLQSLREEYDTICQHVPEFSKFPLSDFIWARHVVITRIFGLIIAGTKTEGLVPMADLLNHKRPRDTKWTFDSSLHAFTVVSLRPISTGEQVFDSYGRKCNSRFFVNYGFSLEENEDNEVLIEFELDEADVLFGQKVRLLGHEGRGTRRAFQIPANTRDNKDREMLSFCRFVCSSQDDLLLFPASYSFAVDDIAPICIENEIRVLEMIRKGAMKTLDGFFCSIAEDNRLLETEKDMSMNKRNCILMRRGEKQVCAYFIGLADTCIPLLNLSWVDYQVQSSATRTEYPEYDSYISDVVRQLVRIKG